MKVHYIIPLNYRLTGQPENFKIKLYYFRERLSLWYNISYSLYLYLSVFSEIANFQKELVFKEHSWIQRFSILFFLLSIRM